MDAWDSLVGFPFAVTFSSLASVTQLQQVEKLSLCHRMWF